MKSQLSKHIATVNKKYGYNFLTGYGLYPLMA